MDMGIVGRDYYNWMLDVVEAAREWRDCALAQAQYEAGNDDHDYSGDLTSAERKLIAALDKLDGTGEVKRADS